MGLVENLIPILGHAETQKDLHLEQNAILAIAALMLNDLDLNDPIAQNREVTKDPHSVSHAVISVIAILLLHQNRASRTLKIPKDQDPVDFIKSSQVSEKAALTIRAHFPINLAFRVVTLDHPKEREDRKVEATLRASADTTATTVNHVKIFVIEKELLTHLGKIIDLNHRKVQKVIISALSLKNRISI